MVSESTEQTAQIAFDLAKSLDKGVVIALYGDLGAGKTNFVQGLAHGLGIERRILSPTFVFLRTYPVSGKPFAIFHHVDLYRASSIGAAKSVGIEEIIGDKDALVAIEWPEVVEKLLPEKRINIIFRKISETKREITIDQSRVSK